MAPCILPGHLAKEARRRYATDAERVVWRVFGPGAAVQFSGGQPRFVT